MPGTRLDCYAAVYPVRAALYLLGTPSRRTRFTRGNRCPSCAGGRRRAWRRGSFMPSKPSEARGKGASPYIFIIFYPCAPSVVQHSSRCFSIVFQSPLKFLFFLFWFFFIQYWTGLSHRGQWPPLEASGPPYRRSFFSSAPVTAQRLRRRPKITTGHHSTTCGHPRASVASIGPHMSQSCIRFFFFLFFAFLELLSYVNLSVSSTFVPSLRISARVYFTCALQARCSTTNPVSSRCFVESC